MAKITLNTIITPVTTVVGSTACLARDTVLSAYKSANLFNSFVHLGTDRVLYGLHVKNQMVRDNYELRITDHLINYGEREEELRDRAKTLSDSTIASMGNRKEVYIKIREEYL